MHIFFVTHLHHQIQNNTYNFENNLSILRLYLTYPEKKNIEVIRKILVKALMNLPQIDFNLSLHLVYHSLKDELVAKIVQIATLLETANFEEFWKNDLSFFQNINGFEETIRNYTIKLLTDSYQRISKQTLSHFLHQNDAQLQETIAHHGWNEENNFVFFPLTDNNQATPKKIMENVHFDQLLKFLSRVN